MNDILDAQTRNTWESGASFSLRNRVYRVLWAITWAVLASWTPPPMHGWRRFLLRLFGARIAAKAGVYPSAKIWSPANLVMGRYAFISPHVRVYNIAPVELEPYSLVSQYAYLCTGTHDVDAPHFQLTAAPIKLCRRSWVAAEAFVGPGVTLNDGAVLGARGCTFRSLDAWTIYAGNPARPIRPRRVKPEDFPETLPA